MSAQFPQTILSVNRSEFYKKKLNFDNKLPCDLKGHVFIIGPASYVDAKPVDKDKPDIKKVEEWASIFNGDGMIYRLDFEDGEVYLSQQLVKPPCYHVEQETNKENKKEQTFKFRSYGIARLSRTIGMRNQLNTAFLTMVSLDPDKQKNPDRLLVTWDQGRPYEIDTETLEIVTPIGENKFWIGGNPLFRNNIFKQIQTSAHPCFDIEKQEMFTVNFTSSLLNFLPGIIFLIDKIIIFLNLFRDHSIQKVCDFIKTNFDAISYIITKYYDAFSRVYKSDPPKIISHIIVSITEIIRQITFEQSTYLIRWSPKNNKIDKWKLINDNGSPVKIIQAIHQMGLTKDYILLMDTAFTVSLNELIPPPPKTVLSKLKSFKNLANKTIEDEDATTKFQKFQALMRRIFEYPQLSENTLYVVRRKDLETSNDKKLVVQKIEIKGETSHFLVDYDNPEGLISLHSSHLCAMDISNWIIPGDTTCCDDPITPKKELKYLSGLGTGPMDISRLGCITIKVNEEPEEKSGNFTLEFHDSSDWISDKEYTWGSALYAYRDYPNPEKPENPKRIKNIYWTCVGCWEELLTDHIFETYKNYKYRKLPVQNVIDITKKGVPSNLLRLQIELNPGQKKRLTIAHIYQFPEGHIGTSPQFVPRNPSNDNIDPSMDGYIVCLVSYGDGKHKDDKPHDNGNQIWIFDAANLKAGPLCKLWHPELNFGFTIHTTWLPQIARCKTSHKIDPSEDYEESINQQPENIKKTIKEVFTKKYSEGKNTK